jgi:hypothetical protein
LPGFWSTNNDYCRRRWLRLERVRDRVCRWLDTANYPALYRNFGLAFFWRLVAVNRTCRPIFKELNMNKNILRGLALVGAVSASAVASAADDQGVAAITALSGTATTYISAAFAVAVLVAGGFWGIKMMKKAFSKAG